MSHTLQTHQQTPGVCAGRDPIESECPEATGEGMSRHGIAPFAPPGETTRDVTSVMGRRTARLLQKIPGAHATLAIRSDLSVRGRGNRVTITVVGIPRG